MPLVTINTNFRLLAKDKNESDFNQVSFTFIQR